MIMLTTVEQPDYLAKHGLEVEVRKVFVVHDELGNRVETEAFFSVPMDAILAPFVEMLENLYDWHPGMRGPGPYPPIAMFKAVLFGKLNNNMSDRHLERHLLRHPEIAHALGFEGVPSHLTFSYFKRERLTVDLLEVAFNALREHLVRLGAVDFESVTIDSAPVRASVNLARANQEVKLNEPLTCELFRDTSYMALAEQLVATLNYKKATPAHIQTRLCSLNLVVLSELGGFLSQNKVGKYLTKKKHATVLAALAGGSTRLPSEPTVSNFKKKLRAALETSEFGAFRAFLEQFLVALSSPVGTEVHIFFPRFFAALQESCNLVDRDARLGYCASKKSVFVGYRIQLLIDDKKKSPSRSP